MATIAPSAALFEISGHVSTNSTWDEYIYFLQAGAGMSLEDLTFQLQLREKDNDTSAEKTFSTTAGDLILTNDDNGSPTILRINIPASSMTSLEGDYYVDLVGKDLNDKLTHWAHGVLTFNESPIAF